MHAHSRDGVDTTTTTVQDHLNNRPINKLLNRPLPDIDKKEETLPHSTRRKLSQLRTNKSPLLMTYLHKIDPANHPAANCPLCNDPNHDSLHLFNCPDIPTTLTVWDLIGRTPWGWLRCLTCRGRSWAGPERGSEILCVLTHGMGSTTTTGAAANQDVRHNYDSVKATIRHATRGGKSPKKEFAGSMA